MHSFSPAVCDQCSQLVPKCLAIAADLTPTVLLKVTANHEAFRVRQHFRHRVSHTPKIMIHRDQEVFQRLFGLSQPAVHFFLTICKTRTRLSLQSQGIRCSLESQGSNEKTVSPEVGCDQLYATHTLYNRVELWVCVTAPVILTLFSWNVIALISPF